MTGLSSVLNFAKKPTEELTLGGSHLLLLPYGGRVLGLFAAGCDDNFFWTHPDLDSFESAHAFYRKDGWHNSGGDRTWLAPEVDVCFPGYPDTNVYQVPAEMDPGNYAVVRTGKSLEVQSRFTVRLSRSHENVGGAIAKSWSQAANPLRYESFWKSLSDVSYAGYTQHTSLQLLTGGKFAQLGVWNILALPAGSEMLIPTLHKADPKIYSGLINSSDLIVTDRLVRFRMGGEGIHKIGIAAISSAGRMGALYPHGNGWALVIRNFSVNPSGEYIDVPWQEPMLNRDFVYSTQACRINGSLGTYCELEYHATAVSMDMNHTRCDDTSQVWAFSGSKDSMEQIARFLISSDV